MKIAFIGLGNMGGPMALNLVKAGFDLVVHDIDPAKSRELIAAGARGADSVPEAVEQGDPPTRRLQPAWREQMEDMIWAVMNSPEFVFVP